MDEIVIRECGRGRRRSWIPFLVLALLGCGENLEAAQSKSLQVPALVDPCAGVANPELLTQRFVEALFPESQQDVSLACAFEPESTSCVPGLSHLDGVVPFVGAAPTHAECQEASTLVEARRCDRYAKHQISEGLDKGNLALLLDGATRLRDLMQRIGAKYPAMSYYQLSSRQNLFVKWLASAGVRPRDLGACVSGSEEDRYHCLATESVAPPTTAVRGLITLLDQHNGVLVRHDRLEGAADRQALIFASATGPVNVSSARSARFDPTVGPRVQRVDVLAKVFALRLLDGTAVASAETETDAFLALRSYEPSGANDLYTASFGLVSAQVAAYDWDATLEAPRMGDARLALDLQRYFITLRMTALTAGGLRHCPVRDELARLYTLTAHTNFLPGLIPGRRMSDPNPGGWEIPEIDEAFDFYTHARISACEMHQQLASVTLAEDPTDEVFVRDCVIGSAYPGRHEVFPLQLLPVPEGEIIACGSVVCVAGLPVDDCVRTVATVQYEDEIYAGWVEYGAQHVVDPDLNVGYSIDEIIAHAIIAESVESAYRDLLSSDDDGDGVFAANEVYDFTADGQTDLHYVDGPGAVSILNTGVGWLECQAELSDSSGSYSSNLHTGLSCDVDVDGDGVVDSDCLGDALDGELFVPYAIAVRVCPEYTAEIVGVTEDRSLLECSTPWDFTKAVEDFLSSGFIGDQAYAGDFYDEFGDAARTPVVDFAAEALHLTQPVAAMLRHRADFASVVGDVPGAYAGTEATWYNDYAGLSVVDEHLSLGEQIMGRGLDLVAGFGELEVDGETGSEILVDFASQGLAACLGGCDDNSTEQVRALFHRRLRDSVQTYTRLSTDLFDVQWRRLDGLRCYDDDSDGAYDSCASCVVAVDTDGDPEGLPDALECDADGDLDDDGIVDAEGCATQCEYFDTALALREGGTARMDALATTLADQSQDPVLAAQPDLADFIDSVAAASTGASLQLSLAWEAMLGGQDWLGYKVGLWYPGINVDPVTGVLDTAGQIAATVDELELAAGTASFDSLVNDYLTRIAQLEGWHEDIENHLAGTAAEVGRSCSAGATGCDTEWREDYPTVASVNEQLQAICGRTIRLWYYDQDTEQNVYTEQAVGIAEEDCPVFLSPDLEALAPLDGSIPDQAAVLNASLIQVSTAAADIEAYIALIEANNVARIGLGEVLGARADAEARIQNVIDGLVCGMAVVGAVAISVAALLCEGGTAGLCTPPALGATISAWSGAGATCTAAFADNVSIGDAPKRSEVERAYAEYNMSLQTNQELYTLSSKFLSVTTTMANYEVEVSRFQSLVAAMKLAAAYDAVVLDNVVDSYLFDPSVQLFDEESLGSMKNQFRGFARDARDLHHLVQYDFGQAVTEGGTFALTDTEFYYLPRLSEMTIFAQVNGTFGSAYQALESSDGSLDGLLEGERGLNLVSYASLLALVHDSFVELYGDRLLTSSPVYVGSTGSAMSAVDNDNDGDVDVFDGSALDARDRNPGEWAMLADSPFFHPSGYVDIDSDADGTTCPSGQVDLHDYCSVFEDTGAPVADDTCLDVASLPVRLRYDLTYLDHMTRGVNVQTFTCLESHALPCEPDAETGLDCAAPGGAWAPYVRVAADADGDGVFTYAELFGDAASFRATDATYHAAQTRVVQNVMNRFVSEKDAHEATLDASDLEVQPGTYLWLINMSTSSLQGLSSAGFDPEVDMLFGGPAGADTISEQLTSAMLVCTDEYVCPDNFNAYQARLLLLGDGHLGDRCEARETGRQERVAFSMDPDPITVDAARITAVDETFNTRVQTLLMDSNALDRMGAQPLHGNSWILALPGHATMDAMPLFDAVGASTAWSLYRSNAGAPPAPRIRLALSFSYYDSVPQTGDFDYTVSGLLQCQGSDASVCVSGTCD